MPLSQSLATPAELTTYYKEHRDDFNDNFRLKIHRMLSWLNKADTEEQLDFKFISLWIAFNAAYADELNNESGEKRTFYAFLKQICYLDQNNFLYEIIWESYSGPVRNLLDTPYTFQPFWDYHNGDVDVDWREQFSYVKRTAKFAFEERDVHGILVILFKHLYTLRNQIMHGGSTFDGFANRAQLQDACDLLGQIVPAITQIMLSNPDNDYWGKPFYPFVNAK
ncbi:hypothetical protein A1D22_00650 [Pasteurellaceae bacterium LFhippo2]|nr:hypothetical protein [Pasteurellaceae bacterium LFhippo2]